MIKGTIAAAALVVTAGVASAATFDFRNGNLAPNGNYASPTANVFVGGIGVSGSAGTYVFDTIVSTSGLLVNKSNSGLGVECPGFQPNGGNLLCDDEIDGLVDLLTLTFDQEVFFQHLLFTRVDDNDDFDLFIDGVLFASDVNISAQNPFLFAAGVSGTSISIGADAGNDNFRLGAISVAAVPVPAALPLLAAALAGLGLMRRRAA